MYRWELDGSAQPAFEALSPAVRARLASFMDAVVIVDPIEYQHHLSEPADPAKLLRTLHFGQFPMADMIDQRLLHRGQSPTEHLSDHTRTLKPRARARLRWPVEEGFRLGKDCFGLDQAQARLYTAIARHAVLVMAALAICAITAAQLKNRTDTRAPAPVRPGQPPPADPGMIPLSVAEIARLLTAWLTRPAPPGRAVCWLVWRRSHQALARWYHQRTRLTRDNDIAQVS
jgi:hypothetical protein